MAQLSKRDHIAQAALPLFLANGIKGTSIDMVVKTAQVSKPTIYNHFPDKAILLESVVSLWVVKQSAPRIRARTCKGVFRDIEDHWLSDEASRLYGLFIGEGFRAPEAKHAFQDQFDLPWRMALEAWAEKHRQDADLLNQAVDSRIFKALF